MSQRQTYSLEEIKDMLLAQIDQVAHHYAPPVSGSYIDKHLYFTLNPGRVDRSVGSFCIHISGPKAGRWNDYATGEHGDVIDLIALSLTCDVKNAIREARAWLGLQHESPEDRRRRAEAAAKAKTRRIEAERRQKDLEQRVKQRSHALWLSAEERIAGTPVELYLRDTRGLDLKRLGRQPRAIRYMPHCYCKTERVDAETGEVLESFEGKLPAMVALIVDAQGAPLALHRTYLEIGQDGRWRKASIGEPKKVLGKYAGGTIRLWSGYGPQGGKGAPLSECAPDTRVYLTEGIENGLSVACLRPEARVLAAISVVNFANVGLPKNVTEVVLVADSDSGPQAREQLNRAIEAHARQGRTVRIWEHQVNDVDLNDAYRAALLAEQEHEGQCDAAGRAG